MLTVLVSYHPVLSREFHPPLTEGHSLYTIHVKGLPDDRVYIAEASCPDEVRQWINSMELPTGYSVSRIVRRVSHFNVTVAFWRVKRNFTATTPLKSVYLLTTSLCTAAQSTSYTRSEALTSRALNSLSRSYLINRQHKHKHKHKE